MPNDLHLLIRRIQAGMADPDVPALIAAALAEIDPADQRAMLELALHDAVRTVLSRDRITGRGLAPVEALIPAGVRRPVYSAKRDGLRAHWRRELLTWQVAANGRRKMFGAFTHADLMAGAVRRWNAAADTAAAGERWAALADALTVAEVATVAELDGAVLDKLLGAA